LVQEAEALVVNAKKLAAIARKLRTDKRSRRAKFDAEDAIRETDTVAAGGGDPVEATAHAKVSEAVDQELPAADADDDLPPIRFPEQEPDEEVTLAAEPEPPADPTVEPAIPEFLQRKRPEAAR
jgi:hypothetical protein